MTLLVDSSVFIAAGHYQPYRDLLNVATQRDQLLLSAIVVMELFAGFKSQEARQAFSILHRQMRQTGRVVTPQQEDFLLGGQVLFHLSQQAGQLAFKDHFRDGLIAISAARVGATVVTENQKNFELWQKGLARSGRRLSLHIVQRG